MLYSLPLSTSPLEKFMNFPTLWRRARRISTTPRCASSSRPCASLGWASSARIAARLAASRHTGQEKANSGLVETSAQNLQPHAGAASRGRDGQLREPQRRKPVRTMLGRRFGAGRVVGAQRIAHLFRRVPAEGEGLVLPRPGREQGLAQRLGGAERFRCPARPRGGGASRRGVCARRSRKC